MGFKCNEEVDRGVGGRLAKALPVQRDRIPRVFHVHVVPTWRVGGCKAAEGNGGEDGEHRDPMVAHDSITGGRQDGVMTAL